MPRQFPHLCSLPARYLRRSHSRQLIYLACQKSISRSSTEAKHRAVKNATDEVLWVQHLLREFFVALPKPPSLLCDNLSATYVCKNTGFHSCMKHHALDYFFVRDFVAARSLLVQHIPSKAQIANTLNKLLCRNLFLHFRSKIGVSDGSSILWGRIKETR
ncbi:hypothetical protein V6N11_077358 [Hibiscus sabdariffa]|uniref:Uncharacterized protein n=1 Tax=Hibiscus sabdariffa TaxID=183260 RepID=A0ABR2TDB4_9ROSI